MDDFALVMKLEMSRVHMTERDLSDQSLLSRNDIRNLLSGKTNPDEETLKKLFRAMPRLKHLASEYQQTEQPKIESSAKPMPSFMEKSIIVKTKNAVEYKGKTLSASLMESALKHGNFLAKETESQSQVVQSVSITMPDVSQTEPIKSIAEESIPFPTESRDYLEESDEILKQLNSQQYERFLACREAILRLSVTGHVPGNKCTRLNLFDDGLRGTNAWQREFLNRIADVGFIVKTGDRASLRYEKIDGKTDQLLEVSELLKYVFPNLPITWAIETLETKSSTPRAKSEESENVTSASSPTSDPESVTALVDTLQRLALPEQSGSAQILEEIRDIASYVKAGGGIPKFLEILEWQHERIQKLESMLPQVEALNTKMDVLIEVLSSVKIAGTK